MHSTELFNCSLTNITNLTPMRTAINSNVDLVISFSGAEGEYDQEIPQSHTEDQPKGTLRKEPKNIYSNKTYERQYSNSENWMCRLAKQKSNKANLSNYYPQRRVILEKLINHIT